MESSQLYAAMLTHYSTEPLTTRPNVCHMLVFMSVVVTVGVCGNVCCVAAIVKDSVFLALDCVRGVMDVVFSVCIVTLGVVGARVLKV